MPENISLYPLTEGHVNYLVESEDQTAQAQGDVKRMRTNAIHMVKAHSWHGMH